MLKEGFKHPGFSKYKNMMVIGDLYQTINFGGMNINHMGEDDPVASIIETFAKLAD